MNIFFHSQEIDFTIPESEQKSVRDWIFRTVTEEINTDIGEISLVFCSDDYLLDINRQYLDHHYYTDIITFPYSEKPLSADLFISYDRVKENAEKLNTEFRDELYRVIIHGILHLCGYRDDTEEAVREMRRKEDHYLSVRR